MTLLTQEDLETMAANGDKTPLRLHFESEEWEARLMNAEQIILMINHMIDREFDVNRSVAECREFEEKLWRLAYICTDEDYQAEQAGSL